MRLVSPSVMYAPKRPSLMVTFLPVFGSLPKSRSGGLAAPRPRPRPYLGCENSSLALSISTVKISSSEASERVSDLPSAPVLVR